MACKAISPDQRILGSGAFGVFFDVRLPGGALHRDLKIHQITVQQPGFNPLIHWRKRALGGQFRGGTAGHQDQGDETHRGYPAAIRGALRALALADSSAINAEARAIGLVR